LQLPRRRRWRQATASVRVTRRPSCPTLTRTRSAPIAGKRRARRGAPLAKDHAGAVLAACGPHEQGALHGRMVAPSAGAGLARLSGGDQTAVRATSPALGRVDTDAPQWSRSRDGVEEVSPSCRLHLGLGLSAGASDLACGRSTAQLSRSAALRDALLPRDHRQRTVGCPRAGTATCTRRTRACDVTSRCGSVLCTT